MRRARQVRDGAAARSWLSPCTCATPAPGRRKREFCLSGAPRPLARHVTWESLASLGRKLNIRITISRFQDLIRLVCWWALAAEGRARGVVELARACACSDLMKALRRTETLFGLCDLNSADMARDERGATSAPRLDSADMTQRPRSGGLELRRVGTAPLRRRAESHGAVTQTRAARSRAAPLHGRAARSRAAHFVAAKHRPESRGAVTQPPSAVRGRAAPLRSRQAPPGVARRRYVAAKRRLESRGAVTEPSSAVRSRSAPPLYSGRRARWEGRGGTMSGCAFADERRLARSLRRCPPNSEPQGTFVFNESMAWTGGASPFMRWAMAL